MSPALTRRLNVGIEIPSSAAPSRVFNKGSFCRSIVDTEKVSIHLNGGDIESNPCTTSCNFSVCDSYRCRICAREFLQVLFFLPFLGFHLAQELVRAQVPRDAPVNGLA